MRIYADPAGESYDRSSKQQKKATAFVGGRLTRVDSFVDAGGLLDPIAPELNMFTCRQGGYVGSLPVILGEEFDFCARTWARGRTVVARIDSSLVDQLLVKERSLIRTLCAHFLRSLSPLAQQVSSALTTCCFAVVECFDFPLPYCLLSSNNRFLRCAGCSRCLVDRSKERRIGCSER